MKQKPNYAINPTPELDLRSNRAVQPARVIAALGHVQDRMTYTYPSTFIWAVVVAALVLLAYWRYALAHPRPSLQHRVAACFFTVLYLLYVPQLQVHEIQLDGNQLLVKTGAWWMPRTYKIRLDEIDTICASTRSSGRSTSTVWQISYRTQAATDILRSELLHQHQSAIRRELQQRGVVFTCASPSSLT